MKKQINPTIKAHLIRSGCYFLLLLTVCAIPFALAQRHASKQGLTRPVTKPDSAYAAQSAQALAPASGVVPATSCSGFGSAPGQQASFSKGSTTALSNAYLPKGFPLKHSLVPTAYSEKAPYPLLVGLDRHATASDNNLLYVIGGESYNGTSYAVTKIGRASCR